MSIEQNKIQHIAVIMDGNGRWAQERGEDRIYGHINGVESVRRTITAALDNNIKYLTLYTFSTENWGRPAYEVEGLMELFCKCVVAEAPILIEKSVKVEVIGDMENMPENVQSHLNTISDITKNGDKLTLILALNYSSRDEITRAVRKIATKIENKEILPQNITQELINQHLDSANYPDPDLIIRTSGECRLSNFLLWQSAYSEMYFTETLWPDFNKDSFDEALKSYSSRDRRFGTLTK